MNTEEKVSLAKKNIIMIKQMMSDNNSSAETVIKDSSTDYSLKLWAGTQRRFIINGSLSDEEVDVYREQNFDFGIRPLKWNEWFLKAKEYCENKKVSKIPSPTFSEEGYALDVWFNRQIRNRRKLPPDQIKKIESIRPSGKNVYVIEYNGKTYQSAREFSSSLRIPYYLVCNCARIGMNGEEIRSFYEAVLYGGRIVFKGQYYSSLLEFAIKYNFPIDVWSFNRDAFGTRIAELIDREKEGQRDVQPETGLMSEDQVFADEMSDNTSDITYQQADVDLHTAIDSNTIWVGGKPFNSKTEIAKAFGISPATIYSKLRNGWTIEQIVGLEEYALPKVYFRGKSYDSERTLTDAFGVSFTTYKSRLAHGWSQEEALGIVLRIPEDPELNGKFFSINEMMPGIRTVFETNVFCVLGISANSSKRQALDSRDKLEKYNKIGAIEAYKTEFDFPFVQKPNREIGHVQVIITTFGSLNDRWLWFRSEKYLQHWNRRIIDRLKSDKVEYDELLACYYQVLITDPSFSKKNKWDIVLNAIDVRRLMGDSDLYACISDHLGEEDQKRFNKKMVVSSFRDSIIKPLVDNIHYAEGEYLLAAILYWRSSTVSFANYMLEECSQSALSLVNNEIKPIINEVSHVPDHSNPSASETGKIQEAVELFFDWKYKLVVALADALDGQEIYSDIIREKLRKNLWDAGFILWKGGQDEVSARLFSGIYMFCEKEQRQQIKNTFSPELLVYLPESEFSTDEKKKIADEYNEKKNYELAFKWYELAAYAGNADAQYKLGTYYENGLGVPKNEVAAYSWYMKAADNGDRYCLRKLASEFFRGTTYCKKDTEKAKYYWITLFIQHPYPHNERNLNKYFPGWKRENDRTFDNLQYKRKDELERLAEKGILAAAYWIAENFYGNNNFFGLHSTLGYETDKDKARRWYLKAAIFDFPPAVEKLLKYYGINAKEVSTSSAMLQCGIRYTDDSSEQGKDLKFYWLKKAVEHGNEAACNNLGVCYDDAIGTNRDYEKANELYLRAIEYNENEAAYYNYGVNLFYGCGVEKNEEEAIDFLLKAKEKGNQSAVDFLKEHVEKGNNGFEFEQFEDQIIYSSNGLRIELCGIKNLSGKIQFKFWVNNTTNRQYNIWLKNAVVDDQKISSFIKIGNYQSGGDGRFSIVELGGELRALKSTITFCIEIDDESNEELFTTKSVQINASMIDNTLHYSLLENTGSVPSENNTTLLNDDMDDKDEEDNDQDYCFANEDFEDIIIYNLDDFRVDFGGFEVLDEDIYIKIWSKNSTTKPHKLWLKDIVVDGHRTEKYREFATSMPDNSWECNNVPIEELDLDTYYDVEFTVVISDLQDMIVGMAKRVSARIDFSEEEISAILSDHVDYEDGEEADADDGASASDSLFVENSFCMRNEERDGLEIYFPDIPNEYVRATMKEQGWRWHRQKGCWYVRENAERAELARRITGSEIKG